MQRCFEDLTGRTINKLRVVGRAYRPGDRAVLWQVVCETCKTTQSANHQELQLGKARCARAGCGLAELSTPSRAAAFPVAGVRTRDVADRLKDLSIREVEGIWIERHPEVPLTERNVAALNEYFARTPLPRGATGKEVYDAYQAAYTELTASGRLVLRTYDVA